MHTAYLTLTANLYLFIIIIHCYHIILKVPWSKLSNASLALAPHGAFVYKTTNDTVVYEAIKLVPVDSPDAAIVFSAPEPFCTAAKTFDDITSGKVNCSNDEVINERIRIGLNCWASPMSYTTNEPFVNYDEFAWVSADATKCGEYVYQLKDGTGLMQHSCDGTDTNAQSDRLKRTWKIMKQLPWQMNLLLPRHLTNKMEH